MPFAFRSVSSFSEKIIGLISSLFLMGKQYQNTRLTSISSAGHLRNEQLQCWSNFETPTLLLYNPYLILKGTFPGECPIQRFYFVGAGPLGGGPYTMVPL